MFDYLIKTSIIYLKEYTEGNINYLGWESNLSIRPHCASGSGDVMQSLYFFNNFSVDLHVDALIVGLD